jgi:hypothetical protein
MHKSTKTNIIPLKLEDELAPHRNILDKGYKIQRENYKKKIYFLREMKNYLVDKSKRNDTKLKVTKIMQQIRLTDTLKKNNKDC